MSNRWNLRVMDGKSVYVAALTGSAEIGRQQSKDEKHPSHFQSSDGWRVVIAPLEEITVSRKHLVVKPLADGRFLLSNKSANQGVGLPSGQELVPGASTQIDFPVSLRVGNKSVRMELEEAMESLPQATIAPGSGSNLADMLSSFTKGKGPAPAMDADQLMHWIQAFLGLLHSAAGSEDFYVKAARSLVDLVHLDSGRVLFWTGTKWEPRAVQTRADLKSDPRWRPSNRVLSNLADEKKTFWQVPEMGSSMAGIDAVVAAPILDRKGEVIGALYGERRVSGMSRGYQPISQLEAMLVEVLASGVAAGLARVEQEQAALRARLQMEQYFTTSLAAKLVDHPELLVGRDTLVSVLFCDIRGFSRISEKLGPTRTVEWISDVMGVLSECVLEHDGVVMDYIGDELMALWGAPEDQPKHAMLACRAALAMRKRLPALGERWQSILQEPLDVGIGINSGIAQVGNVGSKIKFKYGALGNTVNLASRVQGATKYLKAPVLITDATHAGLDGGFATRRLCQVAVVNIAQPVTLFELVGSGDVAWSGLKSAYEQALDDYSRGDFRAACRILGRLVPDHPEDGPCLILLARAVACLVEEPDQFDPVMVLPGK